jgi:hypothetical protein
MEIEKILEQDFISKPHSLSGVLKLWFRELKEPAVPYEFYDDFLNVASKHFFKRRNRRQR